jgi:hypothetical protein
VRANEVDVEVVNCSGERESIERKCELIMTWAMLEILSPRGMTSKRARARDLYRESVVRFRETRRYMEEKYWFEERSG